MADSSPFVDVPKRRSIVGGSPFKTLSFGGANSVSGELEALKIQVKSLSYEIKEYKNTIELNKVEHEKQNNDLIKQLKEQQVKYESVSSDQIYYYNQNKELNKEILKQKELFDQERDQLNQELSKVKKEHHDLKDSYDHLLDDYKGLSSNFVDLKNNHQYTQNQSSSELESVSDTLQKAYDKINSLQKENLNKDNELESLKFKLSSLPNEFEINQNKTISKQLTEQINYIKDLESKNLNQAEQIKKMSLNKQNIEILKDEKNSLLLKLSDMNKLNDQINDLTLENLNLKQELSKWTVYLNEVQDVDSFFQNSKFLKDENLILTNNFNKISNDLKMVQKDYNELFIKNEQINKSSKVINDKYDNLLKINYELEQQKSLLIEESNFLRDQLKTDLSINENENDQKEYIKNLENIIIEYKNQLSELTKKHKSEFEQSSNKRQRVDNDDEDTTRNFQTSIMKLKDELLKLNNEKSRLTNENVILLKKIQSFESINEQKIRILQLRNNPFQNDQIIKREKLEILEKINLDLLQKSNFIETVPKSIFDKSEIDKIELEKRISNLNKKTQRLREIFKSKSLEFIDAVYSLLGFKLEFLSSNKIKLISKFVKNSENCLIIDPINQTLKSIKYNDEDEDFFKIYDNLISFWIKEKNEIPCFLSALNLELFEKEQIKNINI